MISWRSGDKPGTVVDSVVVEGAGVVITVVVTRGVLVGISVEVCH